MAQNAVAQALLQQLRRKIAAIEGTLPERLDVPAAGDTLIVRQNGMPARANSSGANLPPAADRNAAPAGNPAGIIATGMTDFDQALGGGLHRTALCEIHGHEARDAGAASGFALALASLARRQAGRSDAQNPALAPLLWIGAADLIAETGLPYMPGLEAGFGIPGQALLFARTGKPLDALWIANEAAGLSALAAIIIEIRGNPKALDLTATRRLHRRAAAAGRPVFLLRVSAAREPTAAPVRFCVAAAPACPRKIFGRPLPRSLGPPAFAVTIDKCRANPGRQFMLEWNNDEYRLCQRQPEDPVAMVPLSAGRQDHAPPLWPVLAGRSGGRRKTG